MREIEKQECLVLIPARGGSKGITRKNMALLGGKPLLEFTIKAAVEAQLPGKICLSTDDVKIREFGLSFPIEAPFLRPAELAQDHSDTISVINHTLDWYENNNSFSPEFLVLLQPTSPFRTSNNILDAYKTILTSESETLLSVNPVKEHPCEYITREGKSFRYILEPPETAGRQNFPEVYFINGAILIARISFIKKTGRLFNTTTKLFIMKQTESIDIDEPFDLEFANWLYERRTNE